MLGVKATIVAVLAGGTELLANTAFSNTITTGAIISSFVVVVVAGLFTIRANAARTWKDNYEAEKRKREEREAELLALQNLLLSEREAQQILRHELKNEVAALRMKTDLTAHEVEETQRHGEIMVGFQSLNASLLGVTAVLGKLGDRFDRDDGAS